MHLVVLSRSRLACGRPLARGEVGGKAARAESSRASPVGAARDRGVGRRAVRRTRRAGVEASGADWTTARKPGLDAARAEGMDDSEFSEDSGVLKLACWGTDA